MLLNQEGVISPNLIDPLVYMLCLRKVYQGGLGIACAESYQSLLRQLEG